MHPFLLPKIVFMILFWTLSSAQDGEEPPWENFGLQEELKQIQCDSDPVPFRISSEYSARPQIAPTDSGLPIWELEGLTAKEFCAEIYDGGYPGLVLEDDSDEYDFDWSMAGYCAQQLGSDNRLHPRFTIPPGFDEATILAAANPLARLKAGLAFNTAETFVGLNWHGGENWFTPYYARASLYCRDHCFCRRQWDPVTNTTVESTTRPKGYSVSNEVYYGWYGLESREIDIDHKVAQAGPAEPFSPVGSWTTFLLENDCLDDTGESSFVVPIHLAERNLIECSADPIPEMALPDPYTTADFESIQAMCAVALSGGDP